MKSMRKAVSLALMGAVTLSALAGCTSPASSGSPGGSASTAAGASQETQAAKPSGKATKLTVSVFDRGATTAEYGSVTDNQWTRYIQENFAVPNNLDLEFYPIPRQQEVDKLNTLMASKDAPDVVFTYTDEVYYNYAGQGGLADLTEPIAQFGPNITANIGEDCLKYGRYDGKQYAIYARRALLDVTCHFIRKDWLDTIGYDLQKNDAGVYHMSVEDLEGVLRQFKEKDLDGTGQQVFAMGMSGSGNQNRSIQGIYDAFLDASKIDEEMLATQPTITWPGFKDGIQWINQMYNEGLMDPDYAVQTDTKKMEEYISTGRTGYWTNDSWFGVNEGQVYTTLYANNPKAEIAAFQLDNVNGAEMNYVYPPTAMIVMVPSFSKAVNEAVMYIDWLADYGNDRVLRYGFEGEHYEMADGVPVTKDVEYNAKTRIYVTDLALPYNGDPDVEINKKTLIDLLPEKNQPIRQDSLTIGTAGGYTKYAFGKPNQAQIKYKSNLDSKAAELYVKSIMAKPEEFSDTFDTLLKEYMQIGGQEVADEASKMYQESLTVER